ncbi:MAG: hypothetical protein C0483_00780 [Pirellula sp.]|nr:hypothetical protein [Pirellula sp.]
MLQPNQRIVAEGTFRYDGTVECDIRIVYGPIRLGTGDDEVPPEIGDEVACDTYYVWYGSTIERGRFNAGGGAYPSLAEAKAAAEQAPGIGTTVRWKT